MKNGLHGLMWVLIFCLSACSDVSKHKKVAKEEAEKMGEYFKQGDYAAFVKYMHPEIVKQMGGEQTVAEMLAADKTIGETTVLSLVFGEPSDIISVGEELQCTMNQVMMLKIPSGRLEIETTLIAISPDKGKQWFYINNPGIGVAKMKKTIPSLSEKLEIPPLQSPRFYNE